MEHEEMQKKFMEYQLIEQKMKQMQQQLETSEQQMIEIQATIQSLDDFSKFKEGDEILVPINNGIFAKAKLVKEDNLKVNVGAAIVVEKSIEDTKKLIEAQQNELGKIQVRIQEGMSSLMKRAQDLETELSQAMK